MFSKTRANLFSVAAATLMAFGATQIVSTAAAQAEEKQPVILIVDQTRLVGASKAGQSIAEQMKILQDTANKELEQQIARIVNESEELKSKADKMEEAAYKEKAKKLAIQQNNIPVLREIKVRELSLAEQKALNTLTDEMRPILKEIVEARGATLLLDRSAIMYASTDTDITEEALSKLDEKLTTVKVERVALVQNQAKK